MGRMPFLSPKCDTALDGISKPGLILSSSATRLLRKPCCSLYDASTLSLLDDNSSLVDDPLSCNQGSTYPDATGDT